MALKWGYMMVVQGDHSAICEADCALTASVFRRFVIHYCETLIVGRGT